MSGGSRGIELQVAYRKTGEVDQQERGRDNLCPDREIHGRRMVADGCARVVKQAIEAETAVNEQYCQPDETVPDTVEQVAGETDCCDTAPCQVDIRTGP